MPLLSALGHRFGEQRQWQIDCIGITRLLDHGEIRRGDPLLPHYRFGQPFVQGERKDQRVGERIGDVVDIEDRGHLRSRAGPP